MLKQTRWSFLILAFFLASQLTTSISYAQENSITANDAAKHAGEVQTVCGMVASSKFASQSKKQPTFINLDQPYPNQIFTIVIWGSDRSNPLHSRRSEKVPIPEVF